jgi:hypothetical protein
MGMAQPIHLTLVFRSETSLASAERDLTMPPSVGLSGCASSRRSSGGRLLGRTGNVSYRQALSLRLNLGFVC